MSMMMGRLSGLIGAMGSGQAQSAPEPPTGSWESSLAKFAQYFGTGAANGIGAGLAATDLNNPFRGAGAAVLGGMGPGNADLSSKMQRDDAIAGIPVQVEAERQIGAVRREEALKTRAALKQQDDADAAADAMKNKTHKSIGGQHPGRDGVDMTGFRPGMKFMGPEGKVFIAQQALAAGRAQAILHGIRSGVGGRQA